LTARKSSRPSRHAGLPAALAGPALLAQSSHSTRECYCRSPITAEHDPSLWTVRPPPDAISANALLRTPPRTACSGEHSSGLSGRCRLGSGTRRRAARRWTAPCSRPS
jgi:hypothetical protein